MSPSPSHPLPARGYQQHSSRFQQPPAIPVKATKAFLALRRSTDTHRQRCIPARFHEARPLQWRKVRSSGSYHAESPLWHRPAPTLPPPTPAGTPTTALCVLSPRATVSCSGSSGSSSLVSTVELSVGDVTKPKILRPSQRAGSGQSPSSLSSGGVTSSSSSSVPLSSLTSDLTSDPRLYPLQLKVPSYMRMTTSCLVKRRLQATFTSTYSSLDFVEPGPPAPVRGSGDTAPTATTTTTTTTTTSSGSGSGWGSGEDAAALLRKSVSPAVSGRSGSSSGSGGGGGCGGGGGGFPSVLEASASASPCLARKKGYRGVGVGVHREHADDTVPNIRNNSSVLQSSKLNSALSTRVR